VIETLRLNQALGATTALVISAAPFFDRVSVIGTVNRRGRRVVGSVI